MEKIFVWYLILNEGDTYKRMSPPQKSWNYQNVTLIDLIIIFSILKFWYISLLFLDGARLRRVHGSRFFH